MEPLIRHTPPGPKAREILARDAAVISQSMVREYPLVLDHAEGVGLWDVDGNRYLDFTAGVAVMNAGWNHPLVQAAIRDQLGRLTHAAFLDFCAEEPVRYAEELVAFLPDGLGRVYYSNSGAESIEAALKLARHHTKRTYFISFYGGFHGRTFGALSLTAAKVIQRRHFGPFLPVVHAPYPDPYRPVAGTCGDTTEDVVSHMVEEIFRTEVSPDEVAGIVVEPVQGESGYIVPPAGFLPRLRELCDAHGILLIDDEVQAGFFRTGRFLAAEHSGVTPDIVCLSKAAGGGIPLGITVSRDEVMSWPAGSHASTFGGNTLACAAGRAVLGILGKPGFGKRVTAAGDRLMAGLRDLADRHRLVGDVRGLGLMCGIELVTDRGTKVHAGAERDRIVREAFERGLALLPAGESAIRFCPPLTIGDDEIDTGLAILGDVFRRRETRG